MSKRVLASVSLVLGLAAAGCLPNDSTSGCQQVATLVTGTQGDTVSVVTGLRYIEKQVGTGAEAQSCRGAQVSYVATLSTGEQFDSGAFGFTPGIGQVIAGFEQGVVGMKVGGSRRLIIPPALGYGSRTVTDPQTGQVKIPPNSTLIFDVSLVAVSQ